MLKEVGVLEAKTNLSALLGEIERTGEPVAITRHGRRIARLSPEQGEPKPSKAQGRIAEEIFRFRDEMARRYPGLDEPFDLRAARDEME